jgi:hypothetical protein
MTKYKVAVCLSSGFREGAVDELNRPPFVLL